MLFLFHIIIPCQKQKISQILKYKKGNPRKKIKQTSAAGRQSKGKKKI